MSHDDAETDTISIDDQFETGESSAHIIDAGQTRGGKTTLTEAGFAHRVADSGSLDFTDPRGEGDVECPLGDHPSTSETQDASEPTGNSEKERGGSQ